MELATKEIFKRIELRMFHQKKSVFSGSFKDLPEFISQSPCIDRVKLYNNDGTEILSMTYPEFKKTIADEIL